jgi:hypothetical protein
LTFDNDLQYTHTSAQADLVGEATVLSPIWLDGGSLWEVIFDYGDDAAGASVVVEVTAQTYDSVG